jgi:hypothetical protein
LTLIVILGYLYNIQKPIIFSAANGSTSSKASSRTNDSDEHSNVVLRFVLIKTLFINANFRVQEKPTQIPTFRDMSSRMSVPNLSASEPNSNANGEETRMSKLGRAPGTGELQVIFLSHTF